MADTERKGMVFYYSWMDQLAKLSDEDQLIIINAIFNYDRTGARFESDNPFLNIALEKYYFEIDTQKKLWEKKVGRPVKYNLADFIPYFEAGAPAAEIAAALGCSVRTVANKMTEWKAARNTGDASAAKRLGF